ncbi:sigma-54 dependent transcriptional regulator [Actimicrobium antarcticum]|uniref:Sigma-54 dependent transcriptional regulator n=2 Tax=Actimicrobium antarcticum TaxID=1051899 RepID=A0ABP7T578_9BURK
MKLHGITLLECETADQLQRALRAGCTVGVVVLVEPSQLESIAACDSLLGQGEVLWIGLIARSLLALPAVRTLVADYLINFIALPAPIEHIDLVLRHARGMALVRSQPRSALSDPVASNDPAPMVGNTVQMHRLLHQIKRIARTDAAVLINGQSGTGKELAAQSIHRQSARRQAPFVAVNCGAIPAQLFQSELFGAEKGAYTGATQRRIGRIEAAQGGTLFLDEIGDLPMEMQVNLLRFLQEKTIERVGGNQTLQIDARIIAATHIDLAEAVAQGRFREDLYYRINVVCITTPRLADRVEDIEDIARHYFVHFAHRHNRSLRGFSKSALQAMLHHGWPGNVRELVNRVQRAVVMAEGRFIQPEDLGFDRPSEPLVLMSLDHARATADRAMIRRALAQARNHISQAAQLLGISRVTLYRLIEKYQLHPQKISLISAHGEQFFQLVSALHAADSEGDAAENYGELTR